MSDETEIGTKKLDRSSETIELRFRQKPEMDTPVAETSVDELNLGSVEERMKQATYPTLKRVEELCALLAGLNAMEFTGNSEASSSTCNLESISSSRSQHDTQLNFQYMKSTVAIETDGTDSRTETESLVEKTPRGMKDHRIETSSNVSVRSEEVA